MSLFESLTVTIFSMSLVFLVLAILCAVVKALSLLYPTKALNNSGKTSSIESSGSLTGPNVADASYGELKLINVDEKTAAIIMAIVSDESGIPVSELQFKSIKAVD